MSRAARSPARSAGQTTIPVGAPDAETYDGADLPDEDFNYDEFVRREFGPSFKPSGMKTIWWITAILILVATVVLYFLSAR